MRSTIDDGGQDDGRGKLAPGRAARRARRSIRAVAPRLARLFVPAIMFLGAFHAPAEAQAGCSSPPIIGWDSNSVDAFPVVTNNRVEVRYHDQCAGEKYTRIYGRVGLSGSFQLLRTDAPNLGGWRTFAWTGRATNTTYCFRVEVKGSTDVVRPSGVRCATTAPSATYTCTTPLITQVFPAWRGVEVTTDDRCPSALQTRVSVYDWPNGASSGTLVKSVNLVPAHRNGGRAIIVGDLNPTRRYCFRTHAIASLSNQPTSATRCTMPAASPFTGGSAKTRVTTGVGTIQLGGTSALQGIPFTPWESRVWNFKNKQLQDSKCRSVLVRDALGNFVGSDSGCFGLDAPLEEGQNYYVYLVNGVSTAGSPASCRLYIDDVLITTEKCGWTMTPLSGLTAGDRIQAVHLPPNDLLPPATTYPGHTPPTVGMVLIPANGATALISKRANFIAASAEAMVPANVTAAIVLTGFSPNPGTQANATLSQPLRLLVNDVARADSDNDGLGNALESALGTCSNGSSSTGMIPCASVYDRRDSDGDGISDGWEVLGRKKPVGMTGLDLPLPYWGANPMHKDIFAEVDYARKNFSNVDFAKHPTAEALRLAAKIWAFAFTNNPVRRGSNAADIENPDGQPGVAIHFDTGRSSESVEDWTIYGRWGGWKAFPAKAIPVDTDDDGIDDSHEFEHENRNTLWSKMDDVRYGAFRHITTFGWNAGGGQTQWGVLSQDIAIASNSGTPYSPARVAELITHEMGHTLGFGHASPYLVNNGLRSGYDPEPGGGRNCKPLWYSAMNYAYQGQNATPVHGYADGYSYNQRPMRPRALVEVGALDYYVPNSISETRELFLHALADRYRYKVDRVSGSVDWNRNGAFDNEPVAASLSTHPSGNCEQGRVNRATLPMGFGWEDFEVPSSLASTRSGNLTHLLYTDSEQLVRWITVSFSEDCATADEDRCVTRYPSSLTSDPILAQSAQGADIQVMEDAQGNRFLMMVVIKGDGTIEMRTRGSLQEAGSSTPWSAPVALDTSNASGIPEIVATPGNGSAQLGVLFYKDQSNRVQMRRISGALGDLALGGARLVQARSAQGSEPQPVIVDSLAAPAALYSYSHTLRPAEIEGSGAAKAVHLFIPEGSWARVLRLEVYSPDAIFDRLGEIFTEAITPGSKLAPLWVNTQPGNDRSGRLYLYYGKGVAKLVRSYERGTRSGDSYSSEWVTERYGDIDPGARSGAVLTAAANDRDAEPKLFIALAEEKDDSGMGLLDVRPRPENIEHFTYQGYNDWLTFKYTLCNQTAEAFGKVPNNSSRINCRPLPSNEPSPRLPANAARTAVTDAEPPLERTRPMK